MKHSKFNFKIVGAAVLTVFLFAIVFVSCKKDENTTPVDKAALNDTIAVANNLIATTVEGTKPGEYTIGSQALLQTAIVAAQTVADNSSATQSDVTNATSNLHAALNTYRGSLIQEIAVENLIGFWKMNGNANDSSGHNNNGTVTQGHAYFGAGTPNLTTDRFGRVNMAYHFDHGGNIEVPYSSALNPQQISISLWARQDTAGRTINKDANYMVSMNRWNGYKFQTQSVYKPFFTVHAITPAGDTTYYDRDDVTFTVTPGATWYHLVVTFTSGVEDFYVNGSLVKEWTDVPGTPITVDNIDLTIGSDLPTSKYLTVDPTGAFLVDYGGFWTGDLDDVMFYNIALTGSQVASIYANQSTP